jgi:hypothetical protein
MRRFREPGQRRRRGSEQLIHACSVLLARRIRLADLLLHIGGVASRGPQQADIGAATRVRGAFQDLRNAPVGQEPVRLRDHLGEHTLTDDLLLVGDVGDEVRILV